MNRLKSWLQFHVLKLLILFGGVLLPLCLFGTLAEDVVEHEKFFFDKPILLFVHSHASAVLDVAMIFFTRLGSGAVITAFDVVVFFYLIRQPHRMRAAFWSFSVAGAALLNQIAKHTFERARPDLWLSPISETTFSFPSGHAMQTMAAVAATVVLTWQSRWRYSVLLIGAGFVVLVGLSRIYFGVHFPSDILAGWTVSLSWVVGLDVLFKGFWQKPESGQSNRDTTASDN